MCSVYRLLYMNTKNVSTVSFALYADSPARDESVALRVFTSKKRFSWLRKTYHIGSRGPRVVSERHHSSGRLLLKTRLRAASNPTLKSHNVSSRLCIIDVYD